MAQGGRKTRTTTTAFGMRAYEKQRLLDKVTRFVLEPWKCECHRREISKGEGGWSEFRRKKKNWAVVSLLNDGAARGKLRGDALTIGTRGTYRAIFEEIKRIPELQLAVQGKRFIGLSMNFFYKN